MTPKTTEISKNILYSIVTRRKNIIYSLPIFRNYGATSGEKSIKEILQSNFPNAKNIVVEDISGGCGAMYNVYVESIELKGLSMIKQHQAVTNALKEQIKTFHGIRIETKIPKD